MIKNSLILIGENAIKASKTQISNKLKNKVLKKFEDLIRTNKKKILIENMKDINFARRKKLKENMIMRLELNNKKIESMMLSIRTIASLKDPVNFTESRWKVPNGLKIQRVTVPIGVIGIIYESRPNVTSDVSSLCFKSGNCVILRGGSEAYFSNKIISQLFRKSLNFFKIDKNFVQFVESKDRSAVKFMLSKMRKYIDVIIPRGGKNLVKMVKNYSNVPVILMDQWRRYEHCKSEKKPNKLNRPVYYLNNFDDLEICLNHLKTSYDTDFSDFVYKGHFKENIHNKILNLI